MEKSSLKGNLFVILGGSLWGFSGVCAQFLFKYYNMDAVWLTAMRMSFAGALLTAFMLVKDMGKVFQIFKNKRDTLSLLIFGLIGLLLCQYTYLMAISYSNSGTATVIQYVSPVIIIVYTCLRTPRKPELKEIIAISFALIGTFLIATHGQPDTLIISKQALFYGLISAAAVAVYNIEPKGIIDKYGSMTVTGLGMLIGGGIFLIATGSFRVMLISDIPSLLAFLGLSFLGALVAFTLYLKGTSMIGAVKASMLASVEPVVSTVLSALWLGTEFTLIDIVGFAFIIAIVFIISKK